MLKFLTMKKNERKKEHTKTGKKTLKKSRTRSKAKFIAKNRKGKKTTQKPVQQNKRQVSRAKNRGGKGTRNVRTTVIKGDPQLQTVGFTLPKKFDNKLLILNTPAFEAEIKKAYQKNKPVKRKSGVVLAVTKEPANKKDGFKVPRKVLVIFKDTKTAKEKAVISPLDMAIDPETIKKFVRDELNKMEGDIQEFMEMNGIEDESELADFEDDLNKANNDNYGMVNPTGINRVYLKFIY